MLKSRSAKPPKDMSGRSTIPRQRLVHSPTYPKSSPLTVPLVGQKPRQKMNSLEGPNQVSMKVAVPIQLFVLKSPSITSKYVF